MKLSILGIRLPKQSDANSVLMLFLVLFLTGCKQFQSKTRKPLESTQSHIVSPTDDGYIRQLAQVESVAAQVSTLDSTKAEITISGLLHDGATQIQDIQQQKLTNAFIITVTTNRLKSATANLALIPFDRTLSVSLSEMPKGPCKIIANGVATTLIVP